MIHNLYATTITDKLGLSNEYLHCVDENFRSDIANRESSRHTRAI